MNKLTLLLSLGLLVSGCSSSMSDKTCCKTHHDHKAAPALTQEQIAKAIEKAATPGEAHTKLNDLVGVWNTESKYFNTSDGKPEVSKGKAVHTWVFGKRYIEEKFQGTWMGKPFSGLGYLGYDNTKKKYVSSWIDSMNTAIMITEGNMNDSNKTIEFVTSYVCPVSGQTKYGKSLTKIVSKNEHIFEMYEKDHAGRDVKFMEIVYKRKR